MQTTLLILSTVLAMAWVPVLLRFFRNWRGRANPISLAICFLVAFAIYICYAPLTDTDPVTMAVVIEAVNLAVCVFFYVSFGWAEKRWPKRVKVALRPKPDSNFPSDA
jgi:O-antigen ligase